MRWRFSSHDAQLLAVHRLFFFSSRRRHTRYWRDWSSDVCSSDLYIANVIPWRPPGNRTPTPQETQICLPFIQRQIELVNPDVLVTLGNPSTQTLLSTREGIMKTRGRWFDYDTGTRKIKAMATFHPAYLLRSPSYKRLAWQDLRAIAKMLQQA